MNETTTNPLLADLVDFCLPADTEVADCGTATITGEAIGNEATIQLEWLELADHPASRESILRADVVIRATGETLTIGRSEITESQVGEAHRAIDRFPEFTDALDALLRVAETAIAETIAAGAA